MLPNEFRVEYYTPEQGDSIRPVVPGWYATVCQANGSFVNIGPYSTQTALLQAVRTGINPPARQIPGDERFYADDGSEAFVPDPRPAGGNPSQAEKPPTDTRRQLAAEEEFLMDSNDD